MDLFGDEMTADERSGAILSGCGTYRYHLWRRWDDLLPTMVWVMQNPSSANATQDDPTIRRCIAFAKREGCGGISVRNVFALRATNPDELAKHPDPFGPENERHLMCARNVSLMTILVAGWGRKSTKKRLQEYYKMAACCLAPQHPKCFGTTKDGDPRHPLYLPRNAALADWRMS